MIERALSSAFLVAVAVAQSAPSVGLDRNDSALSYSFNWIVGAAPPARRYVLLLNGVPAPQAIVRDVASLSGLTIKGAELVDPKAATTAVVLIRARPPVWSALANGETTQIARVETDYRVGRLSPVQCIVALRPSASEWDLYGTLGPDSQDDGRLSDEDCWPRSASPARPPQSRLSSPRRKEPAPDLLRSSRERSIVEASGGRGTGHLSVDAVVAVRVGREWQPVKAGTLRTERADVPPNVRCVWREPNLPDGSPGAERRCRLADVEEFRFADD